jgi:hypothetical protein
MRSPVPLLTLLGVVGCTGDVGVTKFNSEPVATITSPGDGDTVTEGQLITLRGIVSDPDDPASNLVASWTAGERTLCERVPVGDGGESSCEATLAAGEEEITLYAQDPANAVGLDSVTVVINTPNAPTLTWLSPQDGDLLTADVPVELAVRVNDDADEPSALALAWTDGDGAALDLNLTPDADGVVRDSLLLAEGSYTVTLTATDSDGLSGVASMSFVVEAPNNVPTCEITAPLTGSNGPGGEPVLLSGLVFDADQAAETLTVSWSSDLMGLLAEVTPSADGDVSFTVDELSPGTHGLTLSVLDAVGASCEAEVLYSVGVPPELELLAPIDGDLFNEGELVSFVATASDAETAASDLLVTWESDLDGLLDESYAAADGSILFETTALSPGEHNVTLTVTDGDGLYVIGTVLISVNDLPGAPTVSLSPSSPGTDDTLTASVTGPSADAEGDPITYSYAWTKDGAATAYSSTTVPATATARGERWAVTVTPDDGWGAGDVGTASVTIQNTAPTLTSVSLTPTAPSEADTLTCTPSGAADVDGDSVSYEYAWTVNGVLIATTTSTLGSSFWTKGDTISCAVTPTDGLDDGAAVSSASVTVGNGAPSITGVTISPSTATVSSTLTCAVTGFSDPDGDADASTFAWTVDGVARRAAARRSPGRSWAVTWSPARRRPATAAPRAPQVHLDHDRQHRAGLGLGEPHAHEPELRRHAHLHAGQHDRRRRHDLVHLQLRLDGERRDHLGDGQHPVPQPAQQVRRDPLLGDPERRHIQRQRGLVLFSDHRQQRAVVHQRDPEPQLPHRVRHLDLHPGGRLRHRRRHGERDLCLACERLDGLAHDLDAQRHLLLQGPERRL